ncbi:MAG TPA: hypothetical protein VIU65_06265 [Pyrinomonadaceae bacterium]
MRRCPKCNRTFQTDTQKFCTHDGGLLFDIDPGLHETVQFDSNKIRDAVAKPTTRDLDAQLPAQFDPEATVVSSSVGEETLIASAPRDDEATVQVRARDTQDLEPLAIQHELESPPAAPSGSLAATMVSPPSGPITPPPISEPLAATQISAPLPTSAPLPAAHPAGSGMPGQPLPPSGAKKKSKAPLILGILAVLFVLGLGALVAAYFAYTKLARRSAEPVVASGPSQSNPSLPTTTATPSEVTRPADNEPPPYAAPADAVQFVNSKDDVTGKLRENYVDFSFYYPDRWVKVPSTDNFIKVERRLPPDFTQENFAVSPWYAPEGATTFDNDFFGALAEKDSSDFSKKFPEYKKISEGPTKAGAYDGYEFRFEAVSRGTDKGDITLWGREIFFPPRAGEKTGVKFLILTTSLAPELKTASDVSEKGELPMLLESFRFGKK